MSRRGDRPDAIAWLLRYHPELPDAQVMKLVGTTKTTIAAIRDRTHWNAANIKPVDPVSLGLCSQLDLDFAVQKAARKAGRRSIDRAAGDAGSGERGRPREARTAPQPQWSRPKEKEPALQRRFGIRETQDAQEAGRGAIMRILIAGAHGTVGKAAASANSASVTRSSPLGRSQATSRPTS